MNERDVTIVDRQTVYRGYFRVDRYRLRHRRFDGGCTEEIEREVFERGRAVAVLMYDPQRDVVILLEQFRVGALAAGWPPWVVEIPAGIVDAGESPDDAARREAWEETGRDVRDLEVICDVLASPGGCSETVRIYLGRFDGKGQGGVFGRAAEAEDIKVEIVPVTEVIRMLDERLIGNAITVAALSWFARHHADVRRRWTEETRELTTPSAS